MANQAITHNASKLAAVVDLVLDFVFRSGLTSPRSAGVLPAWLRRAGLAVQWILQTPAHADHLQNGETVRIGNVEATALAAPGHTRPHPATPRPHPGRTPADRADVLASGVCGRHAVEAGCGPRAG